MGQAGKKCDKTWTEVGQMRLSGFPIKTARDSLVAGPEAQKRGQPKTAGVFASLVIVTASPNKATIRKKAIPCRALADQTVQYYVQTAPGRMSASQTRLNRPAHRQTGRQISQIAPQVNTAPEWVATGQKARNK